MKTTRRNLLKFAGGSVVGAFLTPAPWRLITDTALWSENWPGIPRPARGEVRAKFTHCTLCPGGCAIRARCIGEQPVSLAGVNGGLCPFGVAGHHLPYHPDRLVKAAQSVESVKQRLGEAIAACGQNEHVAVLDLRPGRTASWTYRRAMAAVKNGIYIAPERPEVAVNLANAKTVLSLGAPLLDGWTAPARVAAARDGFRLIHADAVESRTAAMADEWLAVAPGSEEALALAVAGKITAHEAAEATGLNDAVVAEAMGEVRQNGPALVIDRRMSPAAIAANLALGGWQKTIGPRSEAPVPAAWKNAAPVTALANVPDASVRVLIIDDSTADEFVSWDEMRTKLAPGAVVATVSWSREGYTRHADVVAPSAVYPERADDLPVSIDSVEPSFRVATPLVAAPAGVVNGAEFVAGLAGIDAAQALRERADAIHAAGRGTLVAYADKKSTPVKDVSAEDFWKTLNGGGCWIGERETTAPLPEVEAGALAAAAAMPVVVEPGISGSPLLSKVYQESNLRLGADGVAMHPDDARRLGLSDGARAVLDSGTEKREVRVTVDSGVRPGVVAVGSSALASAGAKVVRV